MRDSIKGPRRASFSRHLMVPVPLANAVGAMLSLYFASLTLAEELEGERLEFFALAGGLLSVLAMLVGAVGSLGRVRTLRGLERGDSPSTPEKLAAAVGEVTRAPDEAFLGSLGLWLLTTISLGAVMWSSGRVDGGVALRIAGLGLMFGPLTSLLVHCIVILRSRRIVLWLAELGMTHAQLIAAMPRRGEIRARLVAFTFICVVTPAVLSQRLASALGRRLLDQLMAESTSSTQLLLADTLRMEALTSGGLLVVLVFGLALTTAWLGGTLLGRPLRELSSEARRIAEGDLASPRVVPAEDEIWDVSAAFSTMRAHLADVMSQLQRAGAQISATTEEILSTSGRYEAGATEQASSLDETSATTEELARSARQIAENATSVSEIAHRTLGAAEQGQRSAEDFLGSMSRMRQDNGAIASAVVRLNKRVQQIGKIVEFINGVADKSDLLALNAELEGTKAGEVGRGFSLVAAEMRRLAENVLESTKEIEGLIEEVREASAAAVSATEGGVRAVETGTTLAQQVSESLRQIVDLAGQTSDSVRSISLATQQQQTGTDQLADTMADILRITQQSLNATKQVSTANTDLLVLARDLRGVVERFQIGQEPLREEGS
ncbi:methyl-accepting chemotaxis protein [Pyxidicoccus fallax]|uniref:Methyl-accepting chemotaxis protein n=1 Tax=Pyxidicoccus fallax TaxID=394095 RepID=A0A848LBQ7_9BACT|nr:HAMP domain-containing methyl-accepting chemotaxis protein [Pyxidicoccus fallax]NMO14133.1 methyl-accepting chemotaxis protein [Pyxidicoccus fallax]NPC80886.1 methyl-accepting chemotaxis protein [Pyxidicoccus fallax]